MITYDPLPITTLTEDEIHAVALSVRLHISRILNNVSGGEKIDMRTVHKLEGILFKLSVAVVDQGGTKP
jgi:hypothetical protein